MRKKKTKLNAAYTYPMTTSVVIKKGLKRILQGFCIGTANIIPGVSGGTIALMLGIYEDLIQAISRLDLNLFKMLLNRRWDDAKRYLPWKFLLPLLLGIGLAVICLAQFLEWLFDDYPVYVYAFFFGLIMASVPIILSHIRQLRSASILIILITAGGMYALVGLVPAQTPENFIFVFLSGALAISTMILPGISGSFVLVLIGKYKFILSAINNRDVWVLLTFAMGCLVGIISFVRLLKWLLARYYDITMALLTGMVLGSLRKLWPWKAVLILTGNGPTANIATSQRNVLPDQWSSEVFLALAIGVIGFSTAWFLAHLDPRPRSHK